MSSFTMRAERMALDATAALAVLLCVATAGGQTETATATAPTGGDQAQIQPFVVPPGQEDLLAQMLGDGATLPGQCKFTDGQVTGPVVRSTYACADGEVVIELHHPDDAPATEPHTAQFAVIVHSGSPPAGLVDAIVSLIRAHESSFHWLDLRPHSGLAVPVAPIAVAFIALVALIWAARRRRAR
jgi:hypothetical protein